jgi:hypothetical protein
MNVKPAGVEWCALAFAVLVAHGFLVHEWFYPSSYDAGQYALMGREIAEHGLFHRFTAAGVRTYGYPSILSLVHRAATTLGLSFTVLLFELQLSLYLAACLVFRNALSRTSPLAARIAFCGMLVNFYVLIYTPESLTESMTLSLLVIAGGCWLVTYRRDAGVWPLVAGSLVAGFAVMVRPANMFIVVAWIVGVIVIGLRRRSGAARVFLAGACVVTAVALPALPQLANNVLHFGKWTPLVVVDLGKLQQILGIQNIKYATAMPPVPVAPIYYSNPLWVGTTVDEASPWRWYFDYPGRGVVTLALHTFNLTDQDLLFTYSRDLDPWYRLPLGVINHGAVALGLIGLVLLGRRIHGARERGERDAYLVLLALIGANWAVYAWTTVEMRFGSVLLLVLFPLAGYTAMRVSAGRRVRTITATALGVAGYIVLALLLSSWVREQAAPIREAVMQRHVRATMCCAFATASSIPQGRARHSGSHPRRIAP